MNKRKKANAKANAKHNKAQIAEKVLALAEITAAIPQAYHVFEIKTSSHGLGMFATQDIKKGTEILREAPMLPVLNDHTLCLEAAFALLSEEKKNRFLILEERCSCGKVPCTETQVQMRFKTNAFTVEPSKQGSGKEYGYIYEIASRVNHSCYPNAAKGHVDDYLLSMWAMEDISKGEEITINYVATRGPVPCAQKRQILREKFAFDCSCRGSNIPDGLPALPLERYRGIAKPEMDRLIRQSKTSKAQPAGVCSEAEMTEFAKVLPWAKKLQVEWEKLGNKVKVLMLKNGMFGGTTAAGRLSQVEICVAKSISMLETSNDFHLSQDIIEKIRQQHFCDLEISTNKVFNENAKKAGQRKRHPNIPANLTSDDTLAEEAS